MKNRKAYILGGIILIISVIMKYIFSYGNTPIIEKALPMAFLSIGALLAFFAIIKENKNFDYLLLFGRIFVAAFFIFAALGKIVEPEKFAKEIANYKMLPNWIINPMALIMPWLELFSGVGLLFGAKIKTNSAIIGGMLIIFIIAISSAYARGLNINCGCTAQLGAELVGWGKIFEDLAMLIIVFWTYIDKKPLYALDNYTLKLASN